MDGSLQPLFDLYQFTTGRLVFGIAQVRKAAEADAFAELVQHCDLTLAHVATTREIERRWAEEPTGEAKNPEAQRLDVLVDGALGAIRDHAVAQTRGCADDDPIHQQVATFVSAVFPVSVHAVTSLSHVEELAAVDDIVKLFQGPLAPSVADLGLQRLSKRLADLSKQYRTALDNPPESVTQWGKVRAARAECPGLLLETVCIIVGKSHQRTPEGTAKRLALLGPILKQNEAIGAYLRARRNVADVDPKTGEDVPEAPPKPQTPSGEKTGEKATPG